MHQMRLIRVITVLVLFGVLSLAGCTNITPAKPPQPPYSALPPGTQTIERQDVIVTYNYGDTGPVELTANNVVLSTGQRLILQPAPGMTKKTRFMSSGENFWGDVMKQENDPQTSGKAIFTAIKPGKGKLRIIPNTTETERAVDFWATVQ
jgi:hypothetical protein